MSETYQAKLVDEAGTETVELELISGAPQKSFVRPVQLEGRESEVVWELDADSDDYTYRRAGLPSADYS